jgi:hypothetical protein
LAPARCDKVSLITVMLLGSSMALLYRALHCSAGALALCLAWPAFAADCPSAQKPEQAFRVSVGDRSASEVFRLNTGETRTVARFSGGAIAEQTYYQGLIRLENISDGKRTIYTPRSNLKPLFPLKVGQKRQVEFDVQTPDGKKRVMRAEYKVVGKDELLIGACRYEVLKVEHSNRFGEGPLNFINTDWYAPDIRLIVAREYKSRNGQSEINKYDAISILDGAAAR